MEVVPTRMCELLVGLPDVVVLGIDDIYDGPLIIHIEQAVLARSVGAAGGFRR